MSEDGSPPRDFAGLKSLIAARAGDLPRRLTQIAGFALEHPDEIAFGTVSSIAEQAEVQPSTLVRFSQTLGYQGFSEMQEVFRARLRDRILNYDERIAQLRQNAAASSKPNAVFHGFGDAAERSIATPCQSRLRALFESSSTARLSWSAACPASPFSRRARPSQ